MATMTYSLFCMGNPMVDMQVNDGEELLKKYDLKANNAILAEEKHSSIYEELEKYYRVTYVPGGAASNAARGAAYILPPKSVVCTGCIGDDDLAEELRAVCEREGLIDAYLVKKGERTGACAVVLTGHERSLVTTLHSAEKFEQSHLSSRAVAPLVDGANAFYVTGYFLTHGLKSAMEIGQKALHASKVFALNISAPYIAQFYTTHLQQIIPYCDIVIGNESEAEAWASANGLPDKIALGAIAKALAISPKLNTSRPRIVIFTQGANSTILASSDEPDNLKVFPVSPLVSKIVDTNGAGDAFAGGFLGAFAAGKTIEESVNVGHKLAGICVQQVGPHYPLPKMQIL